MLEETRVYIMTRWAENREFIEKWEGSVLPRIRRKIERGNGDHLGNLLNVMREAYVKCYEPVVHSLNGPDLWDKIDFHDIMSPPFRAPSHRPTKKGRRGPPEEENSSQSHLSRVG
ncbi:hypothetical protein PIB30_019599 [Stylosanthes scabra]|uniref:Uncharacterized protein n=1 Tax=Stylosanthes scabra TaxID=79078 RepID=A0ABU6Z7R2_9FABA|nr:hypothetical protein [Stylosanthes scabra]